MQWTGITLASRGTVTSIREQFPDLPALLADVRRIPGAWLGQRSLLALQHKLWGIAFAEDFHGIPEGKRLGGFNLAAFEKWFDETLNTDQSCVNSFDLARMVAGSDAAGFDLWFEWYDRYRRERPAKAPAG